MEAQRQAVMNAMGMMHDVFHRMRDCGDDDRWGGVNYCRVPTCPRCFMRFRAQETGKAIKRDFEGATNDDLAFFTILLPLTAAIGDVGEIIEVEKRRIRNMFARRRRDDDRWNAIHFVGWWEMDRTDPEKLAEAGRNSRLFYEQTNAPVFAMPGQTLWRPHLHGIVYLGGLTAADFAETLRNYGHGSAYQVDVQEFDTKRPVGRNIQSVVRYALKFRIENDFKCPRGFDYAEDEKTKCCSNVDRNWWSSKDIKTYTEWLMSDRSGFRSLRFQIKKKDVTKEGISALISDTSDVVCESVRYDNTIQDTNLPEARGPNTAHAPHAGTFNGRIKLGNLSDRRLKECRTGPAGPGKAITSAPDPIPLRMRLLAIAAERVSRPL
ncbi:hypothetical protein LH400_06240 [Aurantimonas sp. VKM B-3413]|nr:hypothetical protein [Aurantimonas sp. VKM B-3413]